jgi:DNA repair protein RecO (recombination protein O)
MVLCFCIFGKRSFAMLIKTEGIVLHTLKHTDSGIIAYILTKEYGQLSFIVRGIHSKKGGTRAVYFQPMQILDIEMYYKEGRDLNSIKEVSLAYKMDVIPYNIYRSSTAMFISEIVYRSLTETEPNQAIYNYIRNSIVYLDSTTSEIPNFHIGFLVGYSKYLGISPTVEGEDQLPFFDIQNGSFCLSPPLHGYYLNREHTRLLTLFLRTTVTECEKIPLSGKVRTALLQSLLNFYSFHLPGVQKIKSLDVLTQLFI